MINNKVHIWIGNNFSSADDYMRYFELDYSTDGDTDDPDYNVCGFCRDLGIKWYDEGFIGIIPRENKEVSIDDLLEAAALDEGEKENVKAKCNTSGIQKANALVWYAESALNMKPDPSVSCNGLKYIGLFEVD
ncbi:immunity 22 family protein [Cronobacter sakazakii]|uniref:immunity 22 family protein n=1 Tax=Cronobacter sakazakii TaxID=28141 RepID=UPI002895C204|nr:immunity 22 family protein [Cronobacter sakazakii]MDT3525966.1 immunity 22 family protein [Cronobacter sakazakii]